MLRDRNYRSPEQWAVILLSIMMVIVFSVHFGWSLRSVGLMIFSCGMLTLAIIDQRTKYLPDQLTLPMLWLGLLIQLNPAMQTIGIESAVLGAVFGYLSLWVTAYLFLMFRDKQGVGHGDMKLMALVGAWLGPLSIPVVLLVACLLGLLWQFVAIMRDKAHSQDEFPFGPWIVVSSLAYIFLK
jgi:leader peptidase (prepilin peptidase)/N-methyltransferase